MFIAAFSYQPKTGNTCGVNQQKKVYTKYGIVIQCNLFCDKMVQTTDTFNNRDKSQKHYAEWNKPYTKREHALKSYIKFYTKPN